MLKRDQIEKDGGGNEKAVRAKCATFLKAQIIVMLLSIDIKKVQGNESALKVVLSSKAPLSLTNQVPERS
jgi:hypothetical protein